MFLFCVLHSHVDWIKVVSTLCRLQCSWERGKPVWETSKCNVASESNISGASGPTETVHNHPVMVSMASREKTSLTG